MNKKLLCTLEDKDVDQFKDISDLRGSLVTLLPTLPMESKEEYSNYLKELIDIQSRWNDWWNYVEKKYSFAIADNGYWQIDYGSNNMYLVS